MKKMIKGRRLNRTSAHRKALLRNLACAVLKYGTIETTTAKAKELRPFIEKIITRAKVDNLHNRRLIIANINDKSLVEKLFKEIGPKYKERKGGYIRIIKKGVRKSDSAEISIVQLV